MTTVTDRDSGPRRALVAGVLLITSMLLFAQQFAFVTFPELAVTATWGAVTHQIATVLLGVAVAALAAWCGVALMLPSPRSRRIGLTQVPGIVVFLVALLNGIREVSSLVPLFALAAGAALLRDAAVGESRNRTVYSLAGGIGIVPWGVVAWAQVGALVTGGALTQAVQVGTVALLALAAVPWVAAWRGWRDRGIWEVASVVAFAVLAVVLGLVSVGG